MSGTLLKTRFKNIPIFYEAQPVGPIGDAVQIVKLKHSAPDLPLRFGTTFATGRVGQNIQDGLYPSYSTGAYGANSIVLGFSRPSNVTTGGGVTFQNIVPEDRLIIPETVPLPSYSWENLKAETYKAQVSGQQFLPLPGAFAPMPGSVPRGGAIPTVAGGDLGGGPVTPGYGAGGQGLVSEGDLRNDLGMGPYEMGGFAQGLSPDAIRGNQQAAFQRLANPNGLGIGNRFL